MRTVLFIEKCNQYVLTYMDRRGLWCYGRIKTQLAEDVHIPALGFITLASCDRLCGQMGEHAMTPPHVSCVSHHWEWHVCVCACKCLSSKPVLLLCSDISVRYLNTSRAISVLSMLIRILTSFYLSFIFSAMDIAHLPHPAFHLWTVPARHNNGIHLSAHVAVMAEQNPQW